jgi:hypothetical protein
MAFLFVLKSNGEKKVKTIKIVFALTVPPLHGVKILSIFALQQFN